MREEMPGCVSSISQGQQMAVLHSSWPDAWVGGQSLCLGLIEVKYNQTQAAQCRSSKSAKPVDAVLATPDLQRAIDTCLLPHHAAHVQHPAAPWAACDRTTPMCKHVLVRWERQRRDAASSL